MSFDLQERSFQDRHRGLFPPEQRLIEYLPILARRDSEGFPTGFTPVAPHPGPLTPLGLGPNRHRSEIDVYPQQLGCVPGRGRSSSAASPSSTKRERVRSTVARPPERAAAIALSSAPSAALSRIRARVTLRGACVPLCSRCSSCSRSSSSSVTRFFS